MSDETLESVVNNFESKLLASINFRHRYEEEFIKGRMLQVSFVTTFSISQFITDYRKSKYPISRLDKLVYMLIDIKLQMYLIELELGADNSLMNMLQGEADTESKKTHIELMHLGGTQNVIYKSRALWERLMNFIYYLETGSELNGRTKKGKFFKFINDENNLDGIKWRFLDFYKDYVIWFDEEWRTPETHGGSTLRASLMGDGMDNDDINKILGLNDIVANVLFVNLIDIVNGRKPSRWFWTFGMGTDKLASSKAS